MPALPLHADKFRGHDEVSALDLTRGAEQIDTGSFKALPIERHCGGKVKFK